MKVLGISGGRKMSNSEVLVREALMGAEEKGAQVELIRLRDLIIKPPLSQGTSSVNVQDVDDANFLFKKMDESDGIILGCPVYLTTIPGYVMNIRDRVSGRRQLATKFKIGALIAVGGTDWVNLALATMYLFLPHGETKLVDQMLVTCETKRAQVVLNEQWIARAGKLGHNVAEAIDMPASEVVYRGDEYWTCPICYQNLLRVRGRLVECPICDIQGILEIKGDKIEVKFSDQALKAYRYSAEGRKRHVQMTKISQEKSKGREAEIKEKLKKYEAHILATIPPSLPI